MATGLLLAVAALMLAARSQFELAPEALLESRAVAWLTIALATMVPMAAELFGSSSRGVQGATLQTLPVQRTQVFAAKLGVLLGYVGAAWVLVGAVDVLLDQRFPRTQLEPPTAFGIQRLLVGTVVLALFVTALTAATIRNALGSTLIGLVTLLMAVAAVAAYISPPYRVSSFGEWGLNAAYYSVHPLIILLALGGLHWASTLRGRASARTTLASFRRSVALFTVVLAAPIVALATSAFTTARAGVIDYGDPSFGIGMVIPSPAGDRLLVDLTRWQDPPACSSWVLDVDSGAVQETISPARLAAKVPFGSADVGGVGWSPDGKNIGVEVHSRLPWMAFTGTLGLDSGDLQEGSHGWRPFHETTRWHHAGTEGFAKAAQRFGTLNGEAAAAALEQLAPQYLYLPRRNEGVAFGFSRGTRLSRIDGATGVIDTPEGLPESAAGTYRVDPLGVWVTSAGSSKDAQPLLANSVTGEVVTIPDGWIASRSSFDDIIIRDDAVLVSRRRSHDSEHKSDWAWLRDGTLGELLPGIDAYKIIDLDGDRLVAVSYARKTIELLDRQGQVTRTLRTPATEEN